MAKYKNIMEGIVEAAYDRYSSQFDCCTCERCRNDVIAYALNKLPVKYVVTEEGNLISKARALDFQYNVDVTTALAEGFQLVSKKPRH